MAVQSVWMTARRRPGLDRAAVVNVWRRNPIALIGLPPGRILQIAAGTRQFVNFTNDGDQLLLQSKKFVLAKPVAAMAKSMGTQFLRRRDYLRPIQAGFRSAR